jgi:large subunit ribosomal protein L18
LAKGPRYRVPYRRRRENKTDYPTRRILATSEHPRFVIRISNKHIIIQIVKSAIEGDYIITSAHSKDLVKRFGWSSSGKNTPAAYLLGFYAGYKALKNGIDSAYVDIGLKRATKGSRVFSVVKGAKDAGLDVPIDTDIIPSLERINGKRIAEYAETLKDPSEYEKIFSAYLRRGLLPENLPNHFMEVKQRIEEEMT